MRTNLSPKGLRTKNELLETAYALFLERGIHATSIDDILRVSGKGKSQFYHYFNNKEDLLHRLLQAHLDELKQGDAPYNIEVHSWDGLGEWLEKLITFYRSLGKAKGCILGMIGQEMAPEEELIRQDLQMIFDLKMKAPKTFFIGLDAQGKLKSGVTPEQLSDFLLAQIQGSVFLTKVFQDERITNNSVHLIIDALRSFEVTSA